MSTPRALVFVDGNNWYHSLVDAKVEHRLDLDYAKISTKIIAAREWVGTRYYIGVVPQDYSAELYEWQRRFISRLENTSPKITIHRGRLERRKPQSSATVEMRQYLAGVKDQLPATIWNELMDFALQCGNAEVLVEKAVDVHIAIDMLDLALADAYDHAYLLSADGDFTPVVEAVRKQNKNVYAASLEMGHALQQVANRFFKLDPPWFSDCYRDPPEKARKGPVSKPGPGRWRAGNGVVPVVIRKRPKKS